MTCHANKIAVSRIYTNLQRIDIARDAILLVGHVMELYLLNAHSVVLVTFES